MFKQKIQLFAGTILALNTDPQGSYEQFSIQWVFGIITGLACWFTRFALILMVVMIVFYGIKFMTSQGNQTKFDEAKKSFTWALVGVLVILGTYTIIATVANLLGGSVSSSALSK